MESKSQTKLTRTSSSLLRSPTLRCSSLQSFSSLDEQYQPLENPKPHKPASPPLTANRVFRLLFIAALSLLFSLFFIQEKIPISPNLLLPPLFIALAFFATKGFGIKRFWEDLCRRFKGSRKPDSESESVVWCIGGGTDRKNTIVREGVEFYSNGDFYEGEFHKGKCSGSGVYSFFVHGRYEGDWVDGRYDGYGIESWAKGSRYRGQYREGMRHGYGAYRFFTGDSYSGEWFNGQSHGLGVQACSDGSSYVGEFKRGVKHGIGCYHFRNGDRYAGEYFADKIHGFGVYHFASGHCYEGSWHEGRKQGFGMYAFRNGESRCGEWDCGLLKNPHPPSSDSVLRAAQAARKAAEKAIRVTRVDEQVNRAVMAANRAATAARVAAIKAVQNRMDGKFCNLGI